LEENDLYVKPEKCKWKVRKVGFLGVLIGPEGIKMEEEKVKGVLEWPTPKCVKDVQKFLGLANYYRQFIEGFAAVARPLHDMVKKDKRWDWIERQEKAFKELKEWFTKEPVLAAPDIDKKMRMKVDVSDYAMGGVLLMECKYGLWRLVAFLSKSLNETERNYEIHDKEMLAIIRGLEAWRHFVIYKSTCPENYIPVVMLSLNHTSLPSTVATCLATRFMAVLQPSRYSVFHGGDTPIQLSLP